MTSSSVDGLPNVRHHLKVIVQVVRLRDSAMPLSKPRSLIRITPNLGPSVGISSIGAFAEIKHVLARMSRIMTWCYQLYTYSTSLTFPRLTS
jgi:hypothetical protein